MIGAGLASFGRFAAAALPFGIVVGVLFPPIAALLRPLFAPSVALLLTLALLRVPMADVAERLRRPAQPLVALSLLLFGTPAAGAALLSAVDLSDATATAAALYVCSPPVLSSAAFALILGLDAALALTAMVAATLLTPLLTPLLVHALLGIDLRLDAVAFLIRLLLIVGGAAAGAAAARLMAGPARLAAWKPQIDGAVVATMLVFAIGVMDGVGPALLADPAGILSLVAGVFALNLALQALGGAAAWAFLDGRAAATVALMAGNRNMGAAVAALGATIDPRVFLFFALAQIPIYVLPAVLRPLYALAARRQSKDAS